MSIQTIINLRPQSIELRRNGVTLPAQTVRVERKGGQSPIVADSAGATQTETRVVIVGDKALDIAVGDRFNDANTGDLYEVQSIHPNRQLMTQAIAVMIE